MSTWEILRENPLPPFLTGHPAAHSERRETTWALARASAASRAGKVRGPDPSFLSALGWSQGLF